jgi:nitroreductase
MYFDEILKNRFSVREFKKRAVEHEKLVQILEAGRLAPSAVNFQPWHFIVVRETAGLQKIQAVYPREWFKTAPVVIVACSDHFQSWKRGSDQKDSADIDIAIAVDHMILKATDLELGTCWVCNFDRKRCSDEFQIPPHIEPVVLIPLGYPDCQAPEKKRKNLNEIVHWENF